MDWSVIGFSRNKEFFERALAAGLGHAYIFTGPEMIGKRTFALELAAKANRHSERPIDPDLLFLDRTHSESGRTIGIDEVKNVRSFLSLTPQSGRYKFVIIDDE